MARFYLGERMRPHNTSNNSNRHRAKCVSRSRMASHWAQPMLALRGRWKDIQRQRLTIRTGMHKSHTIRLMDEVMSLFVSRCRFIILLAYVSPFLSLWSFYLVDAPRTIRSLSSCHSAELCWLIFDSSSSTVVSVVLDSVLYILVYLCLHPSRTFLPFAFFMLHPDTSWSASFPLAPCPLDTCPP
ncbi:hypothetical protein F5I97DRAFT_703714 [Phlebopus sp. FC_14]|nr:hypothetical protein F5I97DRAFT_703714 [Phlebopus sp. FC_14]